MTLDWAAHVVRLLRFTDANAVVQALADASPGQSAGSALRSAGCGTAIATWLEIHEFSAFQALPLVELAREAVDKEDSVELAWTKPREKGVRDSLTTERAVTELISTARRELIVAGYQVSEAVVRRYGLHLLVQMLDVIVMCDANAIEARALIDLQRLGVKVLAVKNDTIAAAKFHVKAVVSDRERALITSANFTGLGQFENIEVGVVISGQIVRDLATTLVSFA